MRIERHPFGFGVRKEFPNAKVFRGWEGGCAYKAERDGKPFIIIDEGTMADFLDESDRDLLDSLVAVIEFDDEAEREAYVARKMRSGVDLERRGRNEGE